MIRAVPLLLPRLAPAFDQARTPEEHQSGYAVYRFAFRDPSYEPTPAGVRLAIMIGPEGFKNPAVKDHSTTRTEARTAVVSVSVQSRAETIGADEATARGLLSRVDVSAITRLLQPSR